MKSSFLLILITQLIIMVSIRESTLISSTSSSNQTRVSSSQDYLFNDTFKWHNDLVNLYSDIKFWREIFIFFGTSITGMGILLNMCCILIFYKSKLFRNSSFPYYVYIISIVDTLNILIRFLIPQIIEKIIRSILVNKYYLDPNSIDFFKYEEYTSQFTSDYHCSVYFYFYNSLTLTSVWLMCAVSLERWLVIQFTLQTKFMIKLRAFLILILIFLITFSFNVFDLAPGLYIKPQWYANLTLLCERDDTYNTENNTVRIYKRLGFLTFNTETFAFIRILLQTVVPFLVVLCFNSLIIYNFKQIKLNAFGYGHTKSNSCVSVFSGGSYTSNFIGAAGAGAAHSRTNSLKSRHRKRFKRLNANGLNKDNQGNISSYDFNKTTNKDLYYMNNSSRSPSPLLTRSNTPITPNVQQTTSLVSALNLANRTSSPTPHIQAANDSKSVTSNSSGACNQVETTNAKLSPSKMFDSSYLMPPTHSSIRQQQRLLELNYKSGSPSLGTTNSSANLSVAASSNVTATTNLLTNANHTNTNLSLNDKCEPHAVDYNLVETDLDTTQNSNKLSITVNPIMDHTKSLLTASNTPTKSSCKRRAFKIKINRETDIMLIVLSFSILLSQLPFTIAYYLIYYCNILAKARDGNDSDNDNVYLAARVPIILYIIKLLEMVYFSLNFFFYITLSPSLRKEIKSYMSKDALKAYLMKYKLVKYLLGQQQTSTNNIKSEASTNAKNKKLQVNINHAKSNNNSMNNSMLDADNVYSKSPSKYDNVAAINNNNTTKFFIGSSENLNSNRLNSNSSGEYYEFIQKLRSISPLRRCNLGSANTTPPEIRITDMELSEKNTKKSTTNNKVSKLFNSKPKFPKYKKSKAKLKQQDTKIQIIIDNVNDEENIFIDGCYTDMISK